MKTGVSILITGLLIFTGFASIAQTERGEEETTADSGEQKESFYDREPEVRWIRELKNIIIVPPKEESAADTFNIESPNRIYNNTEGLIISRIRIVRLKPFGTSVTDSASNNITFLGRAGNVLHISTGEYVIRNTLMFREGDRISSSQLAYSERYLRSLRYIADARVTAVPVSGEEAEVLVVVQDILPYSADFGTNFATRANFSITNSNIIGTGIELQAGAFIDGQKDHLMGYRAMLRSSNIGRAFVSFQADYLDRYENQRYGFTLNRDFYTPNVKYAGHLIFYNARTPVHYCDPKAGYPAIAPISIRYKQLDTWFGRSFQLNNNQTGSNITVSLTTQYMHFVDKPEDSEDRYYRFQNRTTWLASLSYSSRSFYKTSMIYNFGRTEDIPYGYLLSIVGGKEMNEKYNRPYIGANLSSGYFIPKLGYLSGAFSYGTFFNNGAEQGVIDAELNYFTNLYVIGNSRQRTFVNGQYTRQLYNRLEDQLIIDGEYGIPGFRNDSVFGRHRLNFSVEHDMFVPRELVGFRFVLYAFAYLSWLGGYDNPIMLSNLYSSFGMGIRIRNPRLFFNTVQIQFAYFPNIPENSKFRHINLSSETVLRPRDFVPGAPRVMPLY